MRNSSETTAGRANQPMGWPSSITGITRFLGGILALAWLLNPGPTRAATSPATYSVNLAWDASPSAGVSGYRVYYGTASGNYTNSMATGNVTTNTIAGLAGGVTYYFAVATFDTNGMASPFSNEINYTVPAGLPAVQIRPSSNGQFTLALTGQIGHMYDILATQDFSAWMIIGTVNMGASGSFDFTDTNASSFPRRFYRTHDTQP